MNTVQSITVSKSLYYTFKLIADAILNENELRVSFAAYEWKKPQLYRSATNAGNSKEAFDLAAADKIISKFSRKNEFFIVAKDPTVIAPQDTDPIL